MSAPPFQSLSESRHAHHGEPASARVHPVIRVICFLVFASCLALGGPVQLLLGGGVLGVCYLLWFRDFTASGARMVFRIRWLLLALMGIYGWLTPGRALLPAADGWVAAAFPTQEGLAAGAFRALALIMIVLAVNALLRSTDRGALLSAIYRLCGPLRAVGISPERLAVRMVLTMEAVEHVRGLVSRSLAEAGGVLRTLPNAGAFVSGLVREVDRQAAHQPCGTVTLVVDRRPALWQWLYPIALGSLLYGGGLLM